jgi:hypothetical protein
MRGGVFEVTPFIQDNRSYKIKAFVDSTKAEVPVINRTIETPLLTSSKRSDYS